MSLSVAISANIPLCLHFVDPKLAQMALVAVNATYTGNATKHALDAVAGDRADQSTENLVRTLFRFIGSTFFSILGSLNCSVTEDDCNDIVQETISKDGQLGYNMLQLLEYKRQWDVVTRDKDGIDKKH